MDVLRELAEALLHLEEGEEEDSTRLREENPLREEEGGICAVDRREKLVGDEEEGEEGAWQLRELRHRQFLRG